MTKHDGSRAALAVSILFITITSIFSLLIRIISCLTTGETLGEKLHLFLFRNALWIIAAMVIIVVLRMYYRKIHEENINEVMKEPYVRMTAGILIASEGFIDLSNSLPQYAMSIISSQQSAKLLGKVSQGIIIRIMTVDIVSILIILCQIVFGIYFCAKRDAFMK